MKHTGFGWRIVLAVYAAFTLGCAGLAVAFPAWGLWPIQLWRVGTAVFWLTLAVVRVVILAVVFLFKRK